MIKRRSPSSYHIRNYYFVEDIMSTYAQGSSLFFLDSLLTLTFISYLDL